MKNSLEITRKYQFGYMILAHIKALVVCGVFQSVAFYAFLGDPVWKNVIAAVFSVVYGLMLYSYAHRLSGFDNKQYTPLKTDLKYGFLWGLVISVTVAVFIIIHRLNWDLFPTNNPLRIVINIISLFWLLPYVGFYNYSTVNEIVFCDLPIWIAIIMIVIPMIATTLGYIAGTKKFSLVEKIDSFTIEKDDNDDDEE